MIDSKIIEVLKENLSADKIETHKMTGDASAREYYSVRADGNSYVMCLEKKQGQQSTDFIKMNSALDVGIKRPEIIYYNLETSIILQEDLGTTSLNKIIASSDNQKREELLKKCIDDIFLYQNTDLAIFKMFENRSFDREKIGFEFDLAVEFFLEKYLETELSNKEKTILDNSREYFIKYFEERKNVVCHRDYHGRNLIFKDESIFHIDFQDARIGPETYDLCSLIDDCYFKLNVDLKNKLLKYFFSKQNTHKEYNSFYKEYQTVAAQRIFKAIGSFTYLTIDKQKKGYEKNIGYAFENLRSILEDIPELEEFRSVLIERYYEN